MADHRRKIIKTLPIALLGGCITVERNDSENNNTDEDNGESESIDSSRPAESRP